MAALLAKEQQRWKVDEQVRCPHVLAFLSVDMVLMALLTYIDMVSMAFLTLIWSLWLFLR
jgi:hypothetical protein